MAPHVITLGTAGGPLWWNAPPATTERQGIATAVVVNESVYLVDCGRGVGDRFARVGLTVHDLRGVLLTHLHSDHVTGIPDLLLSGWAMARGRTGPSIPVLGPGDRAALPPVNERAEAPVAPLHPEEPTSGTSAMVDHLFRAFSTDVTDRMLDSLMGSPRDLFVPRDIAIPDAAGYHPNTNPTPPEMEPFVVHRDENVTVTATLVQHPPIAPAFAFRFDSDQGSVTISGDTAPCDNLVRLARGTDLLLHEAIDFGWAERSYSGLPAAQREAVLAHHRKSHTSAREAGGLAARAGAGALALHHLVPGDSLPDAFADAREDFPGPVLVPSDNERIPLVPQPALSR